MADRVATVLDALARGCLWVIACFVLAVIPWFFGGMGPEGYWFTVWAGRAALLPLGLWVVSSILIRRRPPLGFWVALVCWSLLGVQVWLSMGNPSLSPVPPWEGDGFRRQVFNPLLPSTAAAWQTPSEAQLWLGYGLLALTAYAVGLGRRGLVVLAWFLAANTALLAAVGIPFKYSGNYLLLGRWEMPENYFFSTFTYHNHWCAFALLGLAASLGLIFEHRSTVQRVVLVVFAVVITASAPISVSRMGTLLLSTFLVLAGGVAFWGAVKARLFVWRRALLTLCVVAVAVMMVAGTVLYLNRHGPGAVGQRSWSYIIRQNPFSSRIMLVQDAIPMVRERPLFGWGLGSFGAAFRDYQRPETIVVFNQGRVTRYEHCHNDWMERLVEFGFLGCLFCYLPILVWWRRRHALAANFPVLKWCLLGLGLLCLFSLGDMVFVNRSVAGVAAILLGLLLGFRGVQSGKA